MIQPLPDVATTESPAVALPLDWVGMDGIDLPIQLGGMRIPASVDVAVDLPRADVKGIHMSRLHRLLNEVAEHRELTPELLAMLLQDMVDSHADCGTTAARAVWRIKLLRARPALVTPGLSGWQAYPVTLTAQWRDGAMSLRLGVEVTYSSTCPCSAALSRQVLQDAFLRDFAGGTNLSPQAVAAWLAEHGSLATPHSQRSVAQVSVDVLGVVEDAVGSHDDDPLEMGRAASDALGIETLIARIEAALGTAVQTAVKRADEQAFAQRNGQNLMYVEDATRRILASLDGAYQHVHVSVRHLESLHPHDAVASGWA
ncbi:GTP cyclohydrolase I FolE2 [Pigmentiphaga aceris]|uniref:GTP cyclohydrolase FolE2 n=1 Tax=Pigmentiphaga aceris TaxID=1940612 RepID=A0A5C0B4P2_9BURK|nr:GTP cyclohydrolase I FolE2 [Pigmentiphaga aceris]QEI08623.1 GTP cyclohydrolase I FolE2 [Pigmentiphaga aceris]